MSRQHNPSVVSYTDEILNEDSQLRYSGSFEAIFKERFPSTSITILDYPCKPEILKDELMKADVLLTSPHDLASLIPYTSNIKWVHLSYAGYDPVTKYMQQQSHIPSFKLTRMGGTFGHAMAEYVVSSIIAHERQFHDIRENQKLKRWRRDYDYTLYRSLSELTIGIVGAGDIGCDVAKYCKSMGMRTIGLVTRERLKGERSEFIDEYRLSADLPSLLAESDVICNILPSSPHTVEFFKEEVFCSCTKKPLFINIGRGDAIKHSTVVSAIRNGQLSGAVLDVFEQEPLPEDSELWDIPEVIITPHVSGCTPEHMLVNLFIRNYGKFIEGRQMEYEVDLTK